MIEANKTYSIDYIDQSGMCTCARCPAKYLFQRQMGLVRTDSKRIALDYGTDMHAAFPHCYEEDRHCIDGAMLAFSQGWDKRDYEGNDSKRNKLCARASLAEFHRLHKPSACPYTFAKFAKHITAPTADIVSENEMPFIVDIGADLLFAGRIDAVVRLSLDGSLWAVDYKTSSEISARYFANFENSAQAIGYSRALNLVSLEQVSGLIVEAVRTSDKKVECQLFYAFVGDKQIELFEQQARKTAHEIIMYNEARLWPQRITGCAPYGMFGQPGYVCEYIDICNTHNWEDMAKFYKKTEPFHPFKLGR